MLVVAGNIATGKTQLLAALGRGLALQTFPERWESNPWFEADRGHQFLAQMWFLLAAGADHAHMPDRGGVQERCIHEHALVFGRALLSGEDARLLGECYSRLDAALPDPDLLIYLEAPVPALLERIRDRGRAQEQALTAEQLESLQSGYEELLAGWSRCPILEVDTTSVDLRSDEGTRHVLELVSEALR